MDWDAIEELWCRRHDRERFEEFKVLLGEYRSSLGTNQDIEVLWRQSRSSYFCAMLAEESAGVGIATTFFSEGIEESREALALDKTRVEPTFWLAVNQIELARHHGKLAMAKTLPTVNGLIERAIAIDEEYYFAGPLRVAGRIMHFKPLLLGGSVDRAIDIYKRAMQICPDNSTTLLYYAEALIADRKAPQARAVLRQIMDAPVLACWEWEQERDRGLAAKLLEGMGR